MPPASKSFPEKPTGQGDEARSMPDALARDRDVAFASVAADAQHDHRSLRAADHADGALVAEADHRRAVDGQNLVAGHKARIRGASAGNDTADREPFGLRLQHGADSGQLDAGVVAGGARRERDRSEEHTSELQ